MQFKIPRDGEPVPQDYARLLNDVDKLAENLDRRFRVPLTNIRFGWDPVVGFVPVAGDLVTAALAVRIIMTARRLGADRVLLRRMAGNAALDIGIGLVPIVGAVFVAQLVVGPLMVVKTFPLSLATAHNAVAALLLLSVVALVRFLFVPRRTS